MAYELKEAYSGAQASLYSILRNYFGGGGIQTLGCSGFFSTNNDDATTTLHGTGWGGIRLVTPLKVRPGE